MPQKSFADLGVSRAVAAALRDRGVHTPFPIQELVIADVLAGRDVLAKSPTGSGKTLAFGVPLVERIAASTKNPAGLTPAPTRELVSQDGPRVVEQPAYERGLAVVHGACRREPKQRAVAHQK